MKNWIVLTLVALSFNAFAQIPKSSFEGQIGLNANSIASKNYIEPEGVLLGLSLSGGYTYIFKFGLSIGADVMYQRRGFLTNYSATDADGSPIGTLQMRFRHNYLGIPLRVGYHLPLSRQTKIKIEGGFIPSIYMGGSIKQELPNGSLEQNLDNVQSLDIAAIVQLGLIKRISNHWSYSINMAYQRSFTNYLQQDNGLEARHYNVGLSFGLQYHLQLRMRQQGGSKL